MGASSASWISALNVSSDVAATPGAFQTNDIVYVRAEYSTSGQKVFVQRPLKVLSLVLKTDGSNHIVDKNGDAADGSASANVATNGSSNNTHVKYPFFYRLQDLGNGAIEERHESELLDVTGVNVIRDANNWTNPS